MFGVIKKKIESWGRENPVSLTIFSVLVGLVPLGGLAGVKAYNVGFYTGATTAEDQWRGMFDQKVREGVNSQVAAKCGQAVSEVNSSCQRQTRSLELIIADRNERIAYQTAQLEEAKRRSDIIDLYDRVVDNAQSILRSIQSAREKRDAEAEKVLTARFYSLLQDIKKLNQIYAEWSSIFNGQATELLSRYNDAKALPIDDIIQYLETFSSDVDRRKKVIQSEVDEANKIKFKKY